MTNNTHNDNKQTRQQLNDSGLFAKPDGKTQDQRKTVKKKPEAKKQPAKRKRSNFLTKEAKRSDEGAQADPQHIYARIKQAEGDNAAIYALCQDLANGYKRLKRQTEKAAESARVRELDVTPPTREELQGIVSAAIRDTKASGSEVNSLLKALKELIPELFGDSSNQKPDPCAIVEYVTGWAGASGEQIVAELGGVEFLQDLIAKSLNVEAVIIEK